MADAVRAAGGTSREADPSALNLARPVADGEQVLVLPSGAAPPRGPDPVVSAVPGAGPAGGAGAGSAPASAAPVDLNTATGEQLQQLPGVGPVLAQRILDWRAEHGRFGSVEELREVAGIGERKYADLAGRVRV